MRAIVLAFRHAPASRGVTPPDGFPGGSARRLGLLCLNATPLGWGLNWPVAKVVLSEWPPLTARGLSGIAAGLGLIARLIGESLRVPEGCWPRLLLASLTNVAAWMGFATLGLAWPSVAEAALPTCTMPLRPALVAWVLLRESPGRLGALGLLVGIGALFAGAAASPSRRRSCRASPAPSSPRCASPSAPSSPAAGRHGWPPSPTCVAGGLGCAVLVPPALAFETPDMSRITAAGWWSLLYMTTVAMGPCHVPWFAAPKRLPASTASIATLLTPPPPERSGEAPPASDLHLAAEFDDAAG